MSKQDFEDVANFKKSVEVCTRICKIKQVPSKGKNGNGIIRLGTIFCAAVFACEDKRFRVTYKHGKKRKYQLCGFDGRCNQQSYTPIYWEV